MRNALLIARKEAAHLLNGLLAYIAALLFAVALPLPLFWNEASSNIFLNGQTDLRALFALLPLFLAAFIPAAAMRAWGEEFHLGAIETLTTLPLRDWELVAGKFLGVYAMVCACLACTAPIPILAARLGDLDWGPVIGGYCGALLLAAACVAIALAVSLFTRSQATAFTLSVAVLAGLMLISDPSWNLHSRFVNVARGVLDTRDLLFYTGIAAIFLYAAVKILALRRLTARQALAPARLLEVFAVAAIAVLGFSLSARHFLRADLTEERLYTLNQASIELLGDLEGPLHFKMYFSEDLPNRFRPVFAFIKAMVAEYEANGGGRVRVSYIDPGAKLDLVDEAHKLGVFETKANVMEKDRLEVAHIWFGFALLYRDRTEVFPSVLSIENFEYDVSAAIARLMRERVPHVAFAGPSFAERGGMVFSFEGNMAPVRDELAPISRLTRHATRPGERLDLEDADLAVAWGLHDFDEAQLYALDQFIMSGRPALLLTSGAWVNPLTLTARPRPQAMADDFLAHYGAKVNRDLVADSINTKIKYTDVKPPALKDYPLFPALRPQDDGLAQDFPSTAGLNSLIMPWPSSLEIETRPGVRAHALARTSTQAWRQEPPFEIDPERAPGPTSFERYQLGAALSGRFDSFFKTPPTGSPAAEHLSACETVNNLQIWSSEHLLTQAHNPPIQAWLAATVDYMTLGRRLAGIDRRENAFRPIKELGSSEKARVKWLSVTISPVLILLLAGLRWTWRRRRKTAAYLNAASARS